MTTLEVKTDLVGFPMIRVGDTDVFLHWLPVTKIQFEHFLCDAHDRSFDSAWYEEILRQNPRVTPRGISSTNYWNAFISGVLPAEAQRFAFWCGDRFRLPTADEWRFFYGTFRAHPPVDLEASGLLEGLPLRARDVIIHAEAAAEEAAQRLSYERRLADQMLMRLGVLEWVRAEHGWAAMGEPYPDFCGNLLSPEAGEVALPMEGERAPCMGLRLLLVDGTMPTEGGHHGSH